MLICFAACEKAPDSSGEKSLVAIVLDTGPGVKSKDPSDDSAVSDVNLLVYNSRSGMLEEHLWLDSKTFTGGKITMTLLRNVRYTVAACINFGYKIQDVPTLEKLKEFRYYMVYPDEYSLGLPMAALREGFTPGQDEGPLILKAERLMARITLTIDRSGLDKDVIMTVAEAEIGGCPRSVTPFDSSRPTGRSDVFSKGFFKKGIPVNDLNINSGEGRKSRSVDLYMLESLSGELPAMDNPTLVAVYPYIQLKIDYIAPGVYAGIGKWLTYRFCIGEKEGNADIKRNTRYHFTVCPQGTGLSGEPSWKVEFTN